MTQEIKLKLEQAASRISTKAYPEMHAGFTAGAQTILENPGEWGLVKSSAFESLRHDYNTLSKAIDGVVSNRIEEWKANNDVLKDVSALQYQLAKYREALEELLEGVENLPPLTSIAGTMVKQCEKAKEALKQG